MHGGDSSLGRDGLEAMDVARSPSGGGGGAPGLMDEATISHRLRRAGDEEARVSEFMNEDRREMESDADAGDDMHMEMVGGGQGVPRRGNMGSGRLWS